MSWEVSIVLGTLGASAILIYASTQIDIEDLEIGIDGEKRSLMNPFMSAIKMIMFLFGMSLLLLLPSQMVHIIDANNGSSVTNLTYVPIKNVTFMSQWVLQYLLIIMLFLLVLAFFYKIIKFVHDKGKIKQRGKTRRGVYGSK